MSPLTWAYIAGFFDGEGCVYIGKPKKEGHAFLQTLSMGQSGDLGLALLLEIKAFLLAVGIECRVCSKGPRKTSLVPGAFKPMHYLTVERIRDILGFINGTLEFLRIKKEKALRVKSNVEARLADLDVEHSKRATIIKLIKIDIEAGLSSKEVANRYDISYPTVRKYYLHPIQPRHSMQGGKWGKHIKDKTNEYSRFDLAI